jgi:hypothetical protein
MVLRGNVVIRSLGNQVWDLLIDPNRIGQYLPRVAKIEIIEPKNKYYLALMCGKESKRKPLSRGEPHTFTALVNTQTAEEILLTIVLEWVIGNGNTSRLRAKRFCIL